jgi:phosphate transport system permease protein
MEKRHAYTGRPRERKSRRAVRVAEVVSRLFITLGGIGTIIAVATVFVFLLIVVFPLFRSATVTAEQHIAAWTKNFPIQIGIDEDQTVVWGLFSDGWLELVHLQSGKVLERRRYFSGPQLTAWSFSPKSRDAVFGFADGSVQTGSIGIGSRFLDPEQLPEDAKDLKPGDTARFEKGVVTLTEQGQYRVSELETDIKEPAKGATPSPIVLVDQTKTTTGFVIAALNANGKLRLNTIREQPNLLTGETTRKLSGFELPYEEPKGKGPPKFLYLSAGGDQVYLFWKDGYMMRLDARDSAHPVVAETQNLLGTLNLAITDVRQMIGKATFLVGDTSGRVRAWFHSTGSEPTTTDGGKIVCAHELGETGSPVTALAVSERTRMGAAACEDRSIRLFYVTSDRLMSEVRIDSQAPVGAMAIAPKDDGLVAVAGGLWQWLIDPKHPEVSVRVLFQKVWYEGYDSPQYMWQSSGGTDDFEPKYSLIPLIFGTLKASFYSLLFGVPIALLAAIYTSEFLHPKGKAIIKPTIELMASLPSVVLGFLAGLVFAQFVENVVPTVLASVLTVPLSFLIGAYFWQLLPGKVGLLLARWRFLFICLILPLGLAAAVPAGAFLEQFLFAGDIRSWLDTGSGSSIGGFIFLLLPICAVAIAVTFGRYLNPWLRGRVASWGKRATSVLEFGKFVLGCGLAILLAAALGSLLNAIGMDPRDSFFGPYSQRNALVVGFVMGFAIIPIIYTISEDALSAVPEHLRAGSLAAGATRWQTANRIVIPTAMSGLFSAIMIGMGRAVGETMIVLMATGNTPVMDWSIFSGFRTLSANIAVELPEAVRDSTHYRILFLAALTLFAMTFVLNTFAEFVRLRFRKRAYQL